jgi:CheY-like chemotaxis protein
VATLKILLIEDHPTWQMILQKKVEQAVQSLGHETDLRILGTFEEAWKALEDDSPWQLLVTDIGLGTHPEAKQRLGLRLVELARELKISTIVVSGTLLLTPTDISRLHTKMQIQAFFWKDDFDGDEFITSVQKALGDRKRDGTERQHATPAIPNRADRRLIRDWWFSILRDHGRYHCYAFLLGLPSDVELLDYLTKYSQEFEIISREIWLVIALSKAKLKSSGLDEDFSTIVKEDIASGYSVKIAQQFDIELAKFPCLVLFHDIRSGPSLVISLRKMTASEISASMRSILSTIQKAVSNKKDPLVALNVYQTNAAFRQKGQFVVESISKLAGKTFEKTMDVLISELPKTMIR